MNRWFVVSLSIVLMVGGLLGCAEEETQQERPAPPVHVSEVEQMDLERTINAVATLRANQRVRVRSKLDERVESFEVEEGAFVEEGQLIARLDDSSVRHRVQSAEASLDEARSNLRDARRDFERKERLLEEELIPRREYEEAEIRLETLEAQVDRLESDVSQAREDLEETEIRAPFSGFIGERLVDRGQLLSAGEVIVNVIETDPLQVNFTVSERFSDRIEQGQLLRLTREGNPVLEGQITYISPEVDEGTRSLSLKGYLENPGNRRSPGEFGRLELVTGILEDRIVVPAESLIAVRDGYIVFVVDEENTAHRRDVETGLRIQDLVVIESGLSPGERVVREGHQQVGDGTRVRVVNTN